MRRFVFIFLALLLLVGCASLSAGPSGELLTSTRRSTKRSPLIQQNEAFTYRNDALSIESLVNRAYAYVDRFNSGTVPIPEKLRREADLVTDKRSLLRYAERVLLTLADHHAITGSSLSDSWAVVPSYADLWLVTDEGGYIVDAVRSGSPAQEAGIRAGDRLTYVGGAPVHEAIEAFWADLGLPITNERAAFAARVLAAGRRDRSRSMTFERGGVERSYELPNLYALPRVDLPPVSIAQHHESLKIRINDSLGDAATITTFDVAMAQARIDQPVLLDLTDTPSGGNTTVARAILGWFVDQARPYQVHSLPAEQKDTGIARQWAEQVLPREGKHHSGPIQILVGRWTGSMGEGLAIGFDAIGAKVVGTQMAGLLGAIYDYQLENSGIVLKLPTERLMHVGGGAREAFVPHAQAPEN
jgi:hypothetical protein